MATNLYNWLVLAPHYRSPARNGADILIEGRWQAFSRFFDVDILGECEILRFRSGQLSEVTRFENYSRSKPLAAIRTIFFGSHYLREKLITDSYISQYRQMISNIRYDAFVASYPSVGVWIHSDHFAVGGCPIFVETHNDEFRWFANIEGSASNSFQRAVARYSRIWLDSNLLAIKEDCCLIHVSKEDEAGYSRVLGQHTSMVIPVGAQNPVLAPKWTTATSHSCRIHLVFIGSLGVKMNYDALVHFATSYFPALRRGLGDTLCVTVAGSSPSKAVRRLCSTQGWNLEPDLSEDRVAVLLADASYTIMPFPYTTGSKLKLLKSLAHGIPILATLASQGQLVDLPATCVFSDDPAMWVAVCKRTLDQALSLEERLDLIAIAKKYSWNSIAEATTIELMQKADLIRHKVST